jgi:hypothetical protein
VSVQQQSTQFEQSLGALQLAHEVSLHPHLWHKATGDGNPNDTFAILD